MDDRAIILRCLYENWQDEVSLIGDALVTRIVGDALKGERTRFQAPRGGDHFDLTSDIGIIIDVALLLVALTQVIKTWPRNHTGHPVDVTPERPPREPEDHMEDKEDLATLLVKLVEYLVKEKKAERDMAVEVVRAFLASLRRQQ
jgi:hypothetical protein